ncbi:hypothetical protein TRFO_06282 [Tritrichomonas foetus]|uniref:Uncharacterized protein n=1 Tax=Tritrichomonas foetus TaxID=1144522 RepID=A0A1J4K4I2_9EUKA|nr:hypothetical protein TRFO_06282 [Tritrichomonas foetus]|eukprot:OHT04405.1 hypothetical protein TRFO_06282 [Tritrichomonas foetus]
MELETEFATLCHQFFDKPQISQDPDDLSQFFSRLIQKQQKVQITDEVRYFIPILASYQNGVFCPVLESCVDGISPLHFVPDLSLKITIGGNKPKIKRPSKNKTSRVAPRKLPQTARPKNESSIDDFDIPNITFPRQIAPPQTARPFGSSNYHPHSTRSMSFRKPLPPLKETQDNVLPSLYISDKQNFFIAKKANIEDQNYSILPPDYPDHMIGSDFAVLSAGGVIMTHGDHADVVDLGQFVDDLSKVYIVERQMFRLRYSYRFFYTWRERYRDRLFRKIIHFYDQKGAVGRPNFSQFLDKIRDDIIVSTDDLMPVYPLEFDNKNEEIDFSELIDIASNRIAAIDQRAKLMAEDTGRQTAELFKQVRAANLLMQLDFEELHSLNSLPPTLQTFASDLKWRVPSLFRQRLRENILKRERKLAGKRQEYLTCFFTRARILYSGILINQCKKCLMQFLDRFSTKRIHKRRSHKLTANFDPDGGIKIYPSRNLFMNWVERTSEAIIDAFLSENKHISTDVIADVDPEYEFEIEDPKKILSRYPDLNSLKNDAIGELSAVFNFVDQEISPHSNFLKNLKRLADEASTFSEFRRCDSVESMINSLLTAKQNLQKRPRNIYHTLPDNKEATDFVLDMRPSIEEGGKLLEKGIKTFQLNFLAELNQQFDEIQEMWSKLKDSNITREQCTQLEMKMVTFSTLCDMMGTAWKETISDIRATFDTISGVYRSLNGKTKFCSSESIAFFNNSCEKIGIGLIKMNENNDFNLQEYTEEYEYEEEEEEAK